jgi:site-specific DNA-cytosine methylase
MKKNGINVLSLFDGISCAKLALEKAGIKINKYYSAEIDKSALAVQNHHYSADTRFIQLGDVKNVDGFELSNEIDLVILGSPCTQLTSINGKDKSGLEGEDSKLFYDALLIMGQLYSFQPLMKKLYFIMENVGSMSNANREKITNELGVILPDVQLLSIDSALVSPAHRRRYYWTNIPRATSPQAIDIKYADIIENGYVDREKANVVLSSNVTLTNGIGRYYFRRIGNIIFKDKEFADYTTDEKLAIYPILLANSGYMGKSKVVVNEYDFPNGVYRLPSIKEYSRMMTIPDNYLTDIDTISRTEKQRLIGLGFTVDVVAHLLKQLKKAQNAKVKFC